MFKKILLIATSCSWQTFLLCCFCRLVTIFCFEAKSEENVSSLHFILVLILRMVARFSYFLASNEASVMPDV